MMVEDVLKSSACLQTAVVQNNVRSKYFRVECARPAGHKGWDRGNIGKGLISVTSSSADGLPCSNRVKGIVSELRYLGPGVAAEARG